MAKSGLRHIDVGPELTKTEWESEESHELIHGTSFPASPVERQLFYRDDEHKWYVYDGTEWVSLQGGGMEVHGNEYHEPDFTTEVALDAHETATSGVHGAGSNHLALAPAASHLVRGFTKGWTSGKLLKGGGVDADPTETLGTKRFFPRVNSNGDDLEWVRGYPFGVAGEFSVDFAHWTSTLTGSATEHQKGYGILELRTGTTANSTARARGYDFGWLTWSGLRIVWQIKLYNEATYLSSNSKRWIKIDIDAHGDPTGESIGFRIDYDQIKGFVHDGTTLHVTSALATGSGGTFEVRFDGTTVYWYYNGALKDSSTDVPSALRSANHYLIVDVTNGSDTTNNRIRAQNHFWVQEI